MARKLTKCWPPVLAISICTFSPGASRESRSIIHGRFKNDRSHQIEVASIRFLKLLHMSEVGTS